MHVFRPPDESKETPAFSVVGSTVQIDYRVEDADSIEIAISDQGPGIPDYAEERVFERFYSLKEAFVCLRHLCNIVDHLLFVLLVYVI